MTKDFILSEIKCVEAELGGDVGWSRFAKEAGIKESDRKGVYWVNWGDAREEAGLSRNLFLRTYSDEQLLRAFADLVRELKRVPRKPELQMKRRRDPTFPNYGSFLRFKSKDNLLRRVIGYCQALQGYDDVLTICQAAVRDTVADSFPRVRNKEVPLGFVYLQKSGRYYKIGRTNSLGRRDYEVRLQLPEKPTLVHSIRTDDPAGIEKYWHERFRDKRGNGEWFTLTPDDIAAFKRRKEM